jgi:DNA-directed RNA polymerase subunit RPC12/RpoP
VSEHEEASTLDGNAMAGDLREIFAMDVTDAQYTCAGCGHADAVATLRLWGSTVGRVARCPHCSDVVLRVVRAPDRVFLDLHGCVRLEVPLAGS